MSNTKEVLRSLNDSNEPVIKKVKTEQNNEGSELELVINSEEDTQVGDSVTIGDSPAEDGVYRLEDGSYISVRKGVIIDLFGDDANDAVKVVRGGKVVKLTPEQIKNITLYIFN